MHLLASLLLGLISFTVGSLCRPLTERWADSIWAGVQHKLATGESYTRSGSFDRITIDLVAWFLRQRFRAADDLTHGLERFIGSHVQLSPRIRYTTTSACEFSPFSKLTAVHAWLAIALLAVAFIGAIAFAIAEEGGAAVVWMFGFVFLSMFVVGQGVYGTPIQVKIADGKFYVPTVSAVPTHVCPTFRLKDSFRVERTRFSRFWWPVAAVEVSLDDGTTWGAVCGISPLLYEFNRRLTYGKAPTDPIAEDRDMAADIARFNSLLRDRQTL